MLITGRGSSDWESTRLNSNLFEGEAEDRVVGSSSLPRGTTNLLSEKKLHQEILSLLGCFGFQGSLKCLLGLVL